jgi:hypothetical protein
MHDDDKQSSSVQKQQQQQQPEPLLADPQTVVQRVFEKDQRPIILFDGGTLFLCGSLVSFRLKSNHLESDP